MINYKEIEEAVTIGLFGYVFDVNNDKTRNDIINVITNGLENINIPLYQVDLIPHISETRNTTLMLIIRVKETLEEEWTVFEYFL